MSGDLVFPYLIGLVTVAASIYASRKSSNSGDRAQDAADEAAAGAKDIRQTARIDKLERSVKYLRDKDVWRQEREYRMIAAMEKAGVKVEEVLAFMPPEPQPEPELLS